MASQASFPVGPQTITVPISSSAVPGVVPMVLDENGVPQTQSLAYPAPTALVADGVARGGATAPIFVSLTATPSIEIGSLQLLDSAGLVIDPATKEGVAAVVSTLGAPAQDGTDATGPVQTTGGVGIRGWLSTIAGRLAGTLTTTVAAGTQAIGTVGVTSLPGSPAQQTGAVVGLAAGTALVGKVGVDQTTPGTTNGVYDTSYGTHASAYYQVTVTTSAQSLATLIGTAVPSWATLAFVTCETTGGIRVRCDGTSPTASVGQPLPQGMSWPITGASSLTGCQMISQSASASMTVSIELRA